MKSFFLFGPRGTGKTTLIKQQLQKARSYDLLDAEVYTSLLRRPKLIEEQNPDPSRIVVIDEIQKLPALLDEVHRLIEKRKQRFLLTGSSARKLRRGGANLLAGRAFWAELHPLNSTEIPDFDLIRYLNHGGLPAVYDSAYPEEELKSYVNLYLQEEIYTEALVRNLPAFARFLDTVALANGQEINMSSLSSDCGVPARTIQNYLEILEDTLLAYALIPFSKTKKRKAILRKKWFLFDLGIVNTLAARGQIHPRSELFGHAFEHFIVNEVRAYLSYRRLSQPLHYWRSTSQFEVDLIIGNQLAVEIKATDLASDKHLKGLRALKEEKLIQRYILVSLDAEKRKTSDGIEIFPWSSFVESLWSDSLVR